MSMIMGNKKYHSTQKYARVSDYGNQETCT